MLPAHLFRPDLFSDPAPVRSAASDDERDQIATILSEGYEHVGAPFAVERCGALHINSNNYVVRTTRGETLLVKRLGGSPPPELETQLRLAAWLAGEGLPLPALQRTATGALIHANPARGENYCVLAFVPGRHFSGAHAELAPMGKLIADMTLALERAPAVLRPSSPVPLVGNAQCEIWRELESRALDEVLGPERGAELAAHRAVVAEALEEAYLASQLEAPSDLAHIDLHPHNLLVDRNGPEAVLDFPSLRRASAPVFIAFGALKLLRQAGTQLPPECRRRSELLRLRDLFLEPCLVRLGARVAPSHLGQRARIEIVRRIFILIELSLRNGDRRWNHVLPVHLAALEESRILFEA
ncbi:hypothetical protein AKJ09_07819 [Labilithrix luteola]|uniref:Aminoglycoside phosphotransferase domain-containing protein n=2 Tax=Labilithrix luteola TaxID=1391654 RepID=A0A0K1Q5P9_9BACT|nr:hypothetical protein AKJ09_07819 [Labilithrix luteola]